MNSEAIIRATRESAVLFDMSSRGRLEVRGSDGVRWLDGMISGDVEALASGADGSGCYAMLLTSRGAIVADLHVGRLGEVFTLESLGSEIPRIRATLEKFIIADDVELIEVGDSERVLGLEGPGAPAILSQALKADSSGDGLPAPNDWRLGQIAGKPVLIAAFGFSGESAFQIRCSPEDRSVVEEALDAAAGSSGILRGSFADLEVLRVEAGIPALGQELDEEVLPPEARLEAAISTTKGCYVGQEIVARLRARGQVNHLLVGLRLESSPSSLPVPGAHLSVGGKRSGEITSVAVSPDLGPIALGYLRREHADPDTSVEFDEGRGRVSALPFAQPKSEGA